MTETEVRDLIDKLQQTLTETKTFGVTALSEISAYVVDKKLDINELKNEIVNLKCERNDLKQRAESAEQCYDSLIQSSAECTSKKIQSVLQDLYNHAKYGAQDDNNDFVFACNQMKDKILAKAKECGVEIKI